MLRTTPFRLGVPIIQLLLFALPGMGVTDIEEGLVGHWKLDDGVDNPGTTTVLDCVGGHHGTLVNGPVWTDTVLDYGGALSFDGIDDHVEIPHSADLIFTALDSYTVTTWVNVTALPGHWAGIVNKSRDMGPWYGLWIDPNNQWVAGADNITGSTVTLGWHHLALVQDGSANSRTVYVDGEVDITGSAINAYGAGDLWFGGAKSVDEYLEGVIDDVRIYNRALSAEEILELINWTGSICVEVDIKPGSYPNAINLGSYGVVPVAIFSSETFDATTVDETSVELAGAGVAVRGKSGKYMAHEEDVNGDGLIDLVVQVETENLDPDSFQDGLVFLTGVTSEGVQIEGWDEITIVPPVGLAPGVPSADIESGLVAHWAFDEGEGDTAYDSSGNDNHGALQGNPQWVDGQISKGLQFDGVDDFVEIPHSDDFTFSAPDSYTVAAWVNVTSLPGQWTGIVAKSRDTAGDDWYGLWTTPSNQWHFVGGGDGSRRLDYGTVTTGWHHLVGVYDADAATLKLYEDGWLLGQNSATIVTIGAGDLWIGGAKGVIEYLNGAVDDVRIYDRALSDEDVVALFNWTGSICVEVNIKPRSYPNAINLGSWGVVPVAIFSSETFDATTVDETSIELAGAGVAVRGKSGKYMAHEEDVNEDGLIDLVVQVETENLDPDSFQDGLVFLTGQTWDGLQIEGCDEVIIVPPE